MIRAWILFFLFVAGAVDAQQFRLPVVVAARSISGEFAVVVAPQVSALANDRAVATNSNFVRLEPALLAVSAERIKQSLWQSLGLADSPSRGQIFLAVHPAHSLDDTVTVVSSRFNGSWVYRVELPDVLTRARLIRAIAGVTLLEFANRAAANRSAEIPDWLIEGFSEQLLAENLPGFILSAPDKSQNDILENRFVASRSGWDLLIPARRILQNRPALTFEQLSWPTDGELSGDDGGVYRASAQLFVTDLIGLKNGANELRRMLQLLPRFYNWQFAFDGAFRSDFPQPVDLEKWWALQRVNFAAHNAGPIWTADASRARLDEILSVPVDYRSASNNLPAHAEVSLQNIIRNFSSQRQNFILQTKAQDLQLAELQMPPPFAELAAQYRQAIADYLGEKKSPFRRFILIKKIWTSPSKNLASDTLKKLDALDARRRAAEIALENKAAKMPALTGRDSNL